MSRSTGCEEHMREVDTEVLLMNGSSTWTLYIFYFIFQYAHGARVFNGTLQKLAVHLARVFALLHSVPTESTMLS